MVNLEDASILISWNNFIVNSKKMKTGPFLLEKNNVVI